MLLHLVVQHPLDPSGLIALSHVAHRRCAHVQCLRDRRNRPPFRRFQQNAGAGDGARIRFAPMDTLLDVPAFFSRHGDGLGVSHRSLRFCFQLTIFLVQSNRTDH
jgi:hypothetical protein